MKRGTCAEGSDTVSILLLSFDVPPEFFGVTSIQAFLKNSVDVVPVSFAQRVSGLVLEVFEFSPVRWIFSFLSLVILLPLFSA